MRYRRADVPGATYFFTLNAADRQGQVLLDHIDVLRQSFRQVRARHPFDVDAIVILPEHLHMLMTLPRDDADFAGRSMLIKHGFSRKVSAGERINASRAGRSERGIWHRRYWEHLIRDDADFERHVDYIDFNPVKNAQVRHARDWPHSSIHRYVEQGLLAAAWASVTDDVGEFGE